MGRRILAVVDVQQLFLSCRDEFGSLARVDYAKLIKSFKVEPGDEVTAIAYVVASPNHDDSSFVRFLRNQGYRTFRMRAHAATSSMPGEGAYIVSRSWAYRMSKELLVWAVGSTYSHFFIVSGSNSFIGPIKAIHAEGKTCTVMAFRSSLPEDYTKSGADNYVLLDENYLYDAHLYEKPSTLETT